MMAALSGGPYRPPTIKDVAALAGVSPMTVSRTLGGGKSVRPEVQERVLEAVRTLGYHLNETASRMRAGQPSGLIGVAITNLGNPYYSKLALGVEEIAAEHGRRMLLGNTGEDPLRERQLIADFLGRRVEGIILVPAGRDPAHLQRAVLGDTPLVLASRTVPGIDADAVLLDDVGGAYKGTRTLLEGGHRRIGYLGNVASVFTGHRRFEGFTMALAEFGLTPDPSLVKRGQQDVQAARTAMEALLVLPDPPTAVFSANNRNTIGVLKAIGALLADAERSDQLPAIVSFDDFELAEMMPVPVTVVDHDAGELGRESARMIFARLTGPGAAGPRRKVEMPTHIMIARP
jgi:LacI family transcriptional regulator